MIGTGVSQTATGLALAWLVVTAAGCTGGGADPSDPSDEVIDRETFVAVYVDLRLAAVDEGDGEAAQGRRAAILREHGVEADDLLAFARRHGGDPGYMREVWDDVAAAMDQQTPGSGDEPGADTVGGVVDAPDAGSAGGGGPGDGAGGSGP